MPEPRENGAPGALPTRDLPLRRRTLYAAELREHKTESKKLPQVSQDSPDPIKEANSRGLKCFADFVMNPIVRLFKSGTERNVRLPPEGLLNHGVVTIPAIDTLRR